MEIMLPDTKPEMMKPEFWINKLNDADRLIMPIDKIEEFNRRTIEKVDAVCDIRGFKESLSRDELERYIKHNEIPGAPRYDIDGKEVTKEFYGRLIYNTNIDGIKDVNSIRYGIAVRNADVRSFPDGTPVFKTPSDKEFDRFQETGCQAFEPVAVLHTSRDREWYYVQMYNYCGWVKTKDIAIGDKDDIFSYVDSKDFIVVTGDYVKTEYNPFEKRVSYLEFTMGTKIPLIVDDVPEIIGNQSSCGHYVVKLAVMGDNGELEFKNALISRVQDVTEGFMPYTRENILKQVFKLLGHRYGWGDSFKGRDCSSTIMYVYKSFGFKLPRNANEQEYGEGIVFKFKKGSSLDDRIKLFDNVKPGAGIFMDGHVMMYIGKDDGIPYMIHAFNGYGKKDGETYKFVPANLVGVTSTLLMRTTGKPFIDEFDTLLQFEL